MKVNVFIAAFNTLVLFSSSTSAQDLTPSVETMGEFTANVSVQMTQPLVEYCAEQVPEKKAELESEFSIFKGKYAEAIKPIMEKLSSSPEFSSPVTEETRAQFKQMNILMLSEIKKLDPQTYCPGFIIKMRSTTVDALRTSIESSLARYQSVKKESKPN